MLEATNKVNSNQLLVKVNRKLSDYSSSLKGKKEGYLSHDKKLAPGIPIDQAECLLSHTKLACCFAESSLCIIYKEIHILEKSEHYPSCQLHVSACSSVSEQCKISSLDTSMTGQNPDLLGLSIPKNKCFNI